MQQRWYQSRTVQGAIIGATGLIIAAIIAGVVTLRQQHPYPTIEVKDLTPNGEQVLARLSLSPTKQLVDSAAFASLRDDNLLWNDTLGVAIRKPTSYEWGTSNADSLESPSLSDALFWHWVFTQAKGGFGGDAFDDKFRFFAVRLDQPTRIILTQQSLIDSTEAGYNPFRDIKYFMQWMRVNYGTSLKNIPSDTLLSAYRQAIADLDSVGRTFYPLERRFLTGVFVARARPADFASGIAPWIRTPLLDRAISSVAFGSPALLVIDRDRGSAIFSSAVQLRNVTIDGQPVQSVTFNRAGYAVERNKVAYIVMLQYLSNQPPAVLDELQRILQSVRLRTSAK